LQTAGMIGDSNTILLMDFLCQTLLCNKTQSLFT
jgi:hypothetical protein